MPSSRLPDVPPGFDISHSAMNRITERKMATDRKYRRELERAHRPVLSTGRAMTDEELVAKLDSLGLTLDRGGFIALADGHLSAEELAHDLFPQPSESWDRFDPDWVWICLAVLWERWLPDRPSMEMLDDRMQEGYALQGGDEVGAVRLWLDVWDRLHDIGCRRGVRNLDALDALFRGSQSLFNWVQDVDLAMLNAARHDPAWFAEGIRYCTQVIHLSKDRRLIEGIRRTLAECHLEVDGRAKHDELFRMWLDEDPQWGWGWIGWSDSYFIFAYEREDKDPERAIEILKRGLVVKDVRDRDEIVDRLAGVYEEAGRAEEGAAVRAQLQSEHGRRRPPDEGRLPERVSSREVYEVPSEGSIRRAKVGPKAPCPCGSGRKYKVCCRPQGR